MENLDQLFVSPVIDFRDMLYIRKLRNDCADYMTRDKRKINLFRQIWWFYRHYKKHQQEGKIQAFLFYFNNQVAGYGVVSLESHPMLSGGLGLQFRDKGLGYELFKFLTEYAKKKYEDRLPVSLEVLETNSRAFSLYERLGFEEIFRKNGVITMQQLYGYEITSRE